jgi:hypothetical protein
LVTPTQWQRDISAVTIVISVRPNLDLDTTSARTRRAIVLCQSGVVSVPDVAPA